MYYVLSNTQTFFDLSVWQTQTSGLSFKNLLRVSPSFFLVHLTSFVNSKKISLRTSVILKISKFWEMACFCQESNKPSNCVKIEFLFVRPPTGWCIKTVVRSKFCFLDVIKFSSFLWRILSLEYSDFIILNLKVWIFYKFCVVPVEKDFRLFHY